MALTNGEFKKLLKDLDLDWCAFISSLPDDYNVAQECLMRKIDNHIGLLMRDFESRMEDK